MRGFIFIVMICFWNCSPLLAQSKLSFSTREFVNPDFDGDDHVREDNSVEEAGRKMPFELVGGLIFLDAELGGNCDQYIFDTGAPTLILNSNEHISSQKTTFLGGFSGRIAMVPRQVKGFQMGGVFKKRILAYYTDMSHLEQIKNRTVKGLIGLDAFKKQEILFNYKKQELVILPKKRRKKRINKLREVHSFKFRKQDHIPIVRVKIGKKTFYFGIDTGAEVNIISDRLLKKIKADNIEISKEKKTIRGIDKNSKTVASGTIEKLSMKGKDFYNMEFVFADMAHINQNHTVRIDGILGYPFLSSEIFSIDFKKNRLYIWEEQQVTKLLIPIELVSIDKVND